MVTVGAEKHNNGTVVLFDIFFGEIGGAIQFEKMKGRKGREPEIRSLDIGLIGSRRGSGRLGE